MSTACEEATCEACGQLTPAAIYTIAPSAVICPSCARLDLLGLIRALRDRGITTWPDRWPRLA